MTSAEFIAKPTRGSAAIAALLLLVAAGCAPRDQGPQEWSFRGSSMGTYYVVKLVEDPLPSHEASERTIQAVAQALDEVDSLMSTYKPDSELSRFNASQSTEPFPFSPPVMAVLERSQRVSEESDGAFDVTVGPLVNAYGFGPDKVDGIPAPETIEALREQVGYKLLELDPEAGTATKRHPALYVDLSGVAKGYAVDRAAKALEDLGHENFMIEIGGEVRARGLNRQGQHWRIAVERPDIGGTPHRIVPLLNLSMATSGDYRNYIMDGDRRLSHTIDPRTGHPVENRLASITVLHPECAMADAYATAFLVLGEEEGHRLAQSLGIAAYFIYHDGQDFAEKSTTPFEKALNQN